MEINVETINKLINNKPLDAGFNGILYRDDKIVYKLYYDEVYDYAYNNKMFMDKFKECHIRLCANLNDDEKRLKLITGKYNIIKHSLIPSDYLTINNKVIGIKMPYLDKYTSLYLYLKQPRNIDDICRKVDISIGELLDNNIYPLDLTTTNIMIHPTTKDLKIIDLDDQYTGVSELRNISREIDILEKQDRFNFILHKLYDKR